MATSRHLVEINIWFRTRRNDVDFSVLWHMSWVKFSRNRLIWKEKTNWNWLQQSTQQPPFPLNILCHCWSFLVFHILAPPRTYTPCNIYSPCNIYHDYWLGGGYAIWVRSCYCTGAIMVNSEHLFKKWGALLLKMVWSESSSSSIQTPVKALHQLFLAATEEWLMTQQRTCTRDNTECHLSSA